MMLPLLACNCSLLEALRQGAGLLAGEPTAVIPQPTMSVPTISLDELNVPLVVTYTTALPRQGAPVRSSSV
jgi:hypothetical protein